MNKLQNFLITYGIDAFRTKYGDRVKIIRYENLYQFSYNQLETKFDEIEQICRGIILDENWNIVSYPFDKFFNMGSHKASKLSGDIRITEKLDGTCIQMYYYGGEWRCSTLKTINPTYVNKTRTIKFDTLFWETFSKFYSIDQFDVACTYIFELCTTYQNMVVKHSDDRMYLIGIRNNNTQLEQDIYTSGFKYVPKMFQIKLDDAENYLIDKSYTFEGLIATDTNFKRLKIKNTSFLTVHHNIKNINLSYYLYSIVLNNEVDEVCAYYAHLRPKCETISKNINRFINDIQPHLDFIRSSDLEFSGRMKYSKNITNKKYRKLYQNIVLYLRNKNIDINAFDLRDFLLSYTTNKKSLKSLSNLL